MVHIGVLALQGAFSEHEERLRSLSPSVVTSQVRTAADLGPCDGIVLPGGESTAMGLIGSADGGELWAALRGFINERRRPCWGTCAGMILLADRCVATAATIGGGQALIGGLDVVVCRNYFGSQISSFEMPVPPPPGKGGGDFNGVFIRAPAILTAGEGVEVLGKVTATPCKQANATLRELDAKIAKGEDITNVVVDEGWDKPSSASPAKKRKTSGGAAPLVLPSAADEGDAREIICAARKGSILVTAFHPELAEDLRWHEYFVDMVEEAGKKKGGAKKGGKK